MRAWYCDRRVNPVLALPLFSVIFFVASVFMLVTLPITVPIHFGMKALGKKGLLYREEDSWVYTHTGFDFEEDGKEVL